MLKEYTYICKRLIIIVRFIKIIRFSVKNRVSYEFHKNHLYPREHFQTVLLCLNINSSRYLPNSTRQKTSEINKISYAKTFLDKTGNFLMVFASSGVS